MTYLLIFLLALALTIILYQLFNMLSYKKIISSQLTAEKVASVEKKVEAKKLLKTRGTDRKKKLLVTFEKRLQGTSIDLAPKKFLQLCAIVCLAVFGLTLLITTSMLLSLISLIIVIFVINFGLNYFKKKRMALFSNQLPDIIDFLSSSLKSGYGVMQSLNMIAKEFSDPAASEFKRVSQDINVGKNYEEAFDKMIARNPIEDLEVLTTAIIVNKEAGGNLSHILDTVSETIRDKERIKGEVNSLTAQGRLSGLILTLLPVGLLLFISAVNPEYVKPLWTHPLGQMLLAIGGFSQILGILLIKKIVKIDW